MILEGQSQLRLFVGGLLGAAAVVGVLAGMEPAYAVGAAIGLVFAILVVSDLALGVCLFSTVAFVEALPNVFGQLSIAKLIGGLLVISWVASSAYRRSDRRLLTAHPVFTALLLLMAVWVVMSVLWARDEAAAFGAAQTWALNLMLVPIVFVAIRKPEHLAGLFAVFVVCTLLSAVVGLAGGGGGSADDLDGGRLAGAGINANQLGGLLILGTVFGVLLAARRERPPAVRAMWLAAAGVCGLAVAMTLSRGALIGLGVCLIVAPLLIGRGRRGFALGFAVAAVLAATVSIFVLVPSEAAGRLSGDATGSGRTDIWAVGWRMVEDNPVHGVGAANFADNTIRYLLQPGVIGRDEYIVDVPKSAHNIYLQVLAELGVVGFLLFMSIVGYSLACGVKAARRFAADDRRTGELLARGLVIATVGFLAFEFFSSQMYSKALWLMIALGPAVLAVATDRREPGGL